MNQKQLLLLGKEKLNQNKIEDAYFKAKKLLSYILKQSNEQLINQQLEEVSIEKQKQYQVKLEELIQGKPLQYITNEQEFMGLTFYVDENVLIPQPDTEILVEKVIETMQKQLKTTSKTIEALDLCTGSGAIAISIAKYVQNVKVTASDISKKALEITKKNAKANLVQEKIQCICSNMFEQMPKEQFDYMVSNPPYIKTNVITNLPQEVKHEPHIALDGGKDGLTFYKIILQNGSNYLKANGYLFLEIGYDQGKQIINIWENSKSNFELITTSPIKDLGGNDRVLIFQKVGEQ